MVIFALVFYSLQDVIMHSFQYLKSVRHIQVDFGLNIVALLASLTFTAVKKKERIWEKGREWERDSLAYFSIIQAKQNKVRKNKVGVQENKTK